MQTINKNKEKTEPESNLSQPDTKIPMSFSSNFLNLL